MTLHLSRLLPTTVIAGLAVVALTACGPTTPRASQPGPTGSSGAPAAGATSQPASGVGSAAGEACALVTTAEAGTIVGATVSAAEQDQGIVKTCRFRPADPVIGSVYVSLLTATSSDFDTAVANLPVAHTDITGIGDRAVFAAGSGELLVLAGSHLISVIIVHKGPTFGTEAEDRNIAQAAVSRL